MKIYLAVWRIGCDSSALHGPSIKRQFVPPRGWKFRIQDILEAINRISRDTQDMGYCGWQQDEKTVDAGMLKGSDSLSL